MKKSKGKTVQAVKATKPPAKKKAPAKPAAKPPVKKAAAKAEKPAKPAKPAPKPEAKSAAAPKTAAPAKKGSGKPSVSRAVQVAQRRKEMAHFREILLRKQKELMQAYKISKGDSQDSLDNGTEDYIDYAVNSYAREFLLSLTELDRKQLVMVEEALRRIDRGEYGHCQQCGEEINRKRLEVAPWARHCVRCQELEEQGLLPQYPSYGGDTDEGGFGEEEEAAPEEEFEAEAEAEEEEPLGDEPLVAEVDDDSEE